MFLCNFSHWLSSALCALLQFKINLIRDNYMRKKTAVYLNPSSFSRFCRFKFVQDMFVINSFLKLFYRCFGSSLCSYGMLKKLQQFYQSRSSKNWNDASCSTTKNKSEWICCMFGVFSIFIYLFLVFGSSLNKFDVIR